MTKSIVLRLTSAIVVDVDVMKKGSLVEVSEAEAKNLLHRGKAVIHDEQPDYEQVDLSKLNKDQLIDLADQYEIDGADKMTKAQLIEAITAAEADEGAE
jgi:hypothetical protein